MPLPFTALRGLARGGGGVVVMTEGPSCPFDDLPLPVQVGDLP